MDMDVAFGDVLHTNSVRVLNPGLAAKFPMFRANQVLVSMRSIDTLAILDLEKRVVTWSAQGLWKRQHCSEFLDNGRILLFDNAGSQKCSRVLEYDPLTGAIRSTATTLEEIIAELEIATVSERQGRAIDRDQSGSMEKKKREGYF